MRISQPVPAPRYSRATPRQTSKPFIKIVPILYAGSIGSNESSDPSKDTAQIGGEPEVTVFLETNAQSTFGCFCSGNLESSWSDCNTPEPNQNQTQTTQNETKPNPTPLPQGDTSCCHVVHAWLYLVCVWFYYLVYSSIFKYIGLCLVLGMSQSARAQPKELRVMGEAEPVVHAPAVLLVLVSDGVVVGGLGQPDQLLQPGAGLPGGFGKK